LNTTPGFYLTLLKYTEKMSSTNIPALLPHEREVFIKLMSGQKYHQGQVFVSVFVRWIQLERGFIFHKFCSSRLKMFSSTKMGESNFQLNKKLKKLLILMGYRRKSS
jgi:hypothetical protein